jgi:hypothetical protein
MELSKLLPIPEKLNVEETPREITISYRWFQPLAIFLVFFCFIWDGILVVFYTAMLADSKGTPIVAMLFPLLHVAVGIGLTWYTISLFINKTYIVITKHNLSIQHKPLPTFFFKKNIELDRMDVEQVYIKEVISRGKNGTSYSYDLFYLDKNSRSKKILNESDSETAMFIRRKIEKYFGIEPKPIGRIFVNLFYSIGFAKPIL